MIDHTWQKLVNQFEFESCVSVGDAGLGCGIDGIDGIGVIGISGVVDVGGGGGGDNVVCSCIGSPGSNPTLQGE